MGVSSYFEFVTTLFGWVAYDAFWQVLADSGLVYVPFVIILMTNIIASRKAGDDEGQAALQSLKKSETDIVLAIAVLFLAAVPFQAVNLNEMEYVRPQLDCAIRDQIANGAPAVVNGSNTDTSYDPALQTLNNQVGRIPIWWGFVHVVSKAVVSASVAGVPCTGDVAAVEFRLENDQIEDPRLAKELQSFLMDCFMPATARFYREDRSNVSQEQLDATRYPGSSYFLGTPGYYDTLYSQLPRSDWVFNPIRDAGFEADQAIGGHPTCLQWWESDPMGLRRKLLGSLGPELLDEYVESPGALIRRADPLLTTRNAEDVLLRKYLAVRNRQSNISGFSSLSISYEPGAMEGARADQQTKGLWGLVNLRHSMTGDLIADIGTNAMAGLGAIISSPGHLAAGVAAREGSGIFLSIVMMVFVCVLPFLMVFSLYRLSTLMTLTVIFFGMHFFYVLWGIAFWVDNHLIAALTDGGFSPVTSPIQTTIIVWVQRFLYVIFPMIWLTGLGWLGHHAGGLMQGINQMSTTSSSAMGRGGEVVGTAVSKGVGQSIGPSR